jgi:ABC-2 type transport system permease protein
LTLFGFALSANVTDVRLAVEDDSRSPESRELISTLTQSKSFQLAGYYSSVDQLGDAVSRGDADAGVVVPYDYARDLARKRPTTVQFLLNATNANTATISRAYAQGIDPELQQWLEERGKSGQRHPDGRRRPGSPRPGAAHARVSLQSGPGRFLVHRDRGARPPAHSQQLAGRLRRHGPRARSRHHRAVAHVSRQHNRDHHRQDCPAVPAALPDDAGRHRRHPVRLRSSFPRQPAALLGAGSLCILSGISIGTVIATFSKSAQQAQLTAFFINPPLSSLSGALNPVEAMPKWLQPLTVLNPVHHFATIVRGSMLKGSGILDLWPNFLALLLFTVVLVSLSISRFRKQLS